MDLWHSMHTSPFGKTRPPYCKERPDWTQGWSCTALRSGDWASRNSGHSLQGAPEGDSDVLRGSNLADETARTVVKAKPPTQQPLFPTGRHSSPISTLKKLLNRLSSLNVPSRMGENRIPEAGIIEERGMRTTQTDWALNQAVLRACRAQLDTEPGWSAHEEPGRSLGRCRASVPASGDSPHPAPALPGPTVFFMISFYMTNSNL